MLAVVYEVSKKMFEPSMFVRCTFQISYPREIFELKQKYYGPVILIYPVLDD